MRRARKKPVRVNAYRLGEQSEGLDRLIKEGLVSQSDDGTFEVHTMETKDEKGETANAGDRTPIRQSSLKRITGI